MCLVCGMLLFVVFIRPLLSLSASCTQGKKFIESNSVGQVASATIYALILNPSWTLASQMKLCCEASRLGD